MASQMVKCKYCGQEKDIRGIRWHEIMCERKQKEINSPGNGTVTQVGSDQKQACDHSWRLLNENDPREKFAIYELGYVEICDKPGCGELR